MISTLIRGGLGNQMFIYAMARALALRNNTKAVFNLRYGFEKDFLFHRKLELQCFNVKLKESALHTFDYCMARYFMAVSKTCGRNVLCFQDKLYFEEEPYRFQEEFVKKEVKNAFLEGYWQSEKYFTDFADVIRNDFQITIPIDKDVEAELNEILAGEYTPVMIGIRRYQECTSVKEGVVLEEDYYNRAIRHIESKVANPKFIVFTQQPEWAKKHIKTNSLVYYVKPKDGEFNSVQDLYLMTHCQHAIISNSSFYWWGAWLSENRNNIVIAPKNFLNKDSVCERWIQL